MDDKHRKLRMTARALGRAGLVHAFGHCSVREDENHFWVCPSLPLSCIAVGAPNSRVPVTGPLPDGVLGEVRIHQYIYQSRPDIQAVGRIMPPAVMALSTQGITPKSRHGLGAYFANDIPLWDDPRLLRNDQAAEKLVAQMGERLAIVMRGNGAVVASSSLEEVLSYAWFLEDAARLELSVRSAGFGPENGLLSDSEVVDRQVTTADVFARMWRYLTNGDPEAVAA